MTMNREAQVQQAEETLGDRLRGAGFAKGLFFGEYRRDRLLPFPDLEADAAANDLVARLQEFCRTQINPQAIDVHAEIPPHVIRGLGELGVLGACLPKRCGGLQWSQTNYCRLLEVLGGHCGSTALFVNAHHSIGPRALTLFGAPEQQDRWLPKLARGEWISAFALTEPEAGSDAANVQTTATPTPDGSGFLLRGEKRWITNGGIADVLTVMARTPVPGASDTKITAFLVPRHAPGFQVVEPRMAKCGVRGTATSRLAFRDLFVPRENVLGKLGQGLKIALSVLDFGRTTFGASCTGAAKFCVARAARHANTRVQFGQTLGSFELVKEKLAWMAAATYAMESATYQTAALIDSGADDFLLETAMLKVFSTECLWRIVNDTIQIFGGKAYFSDEPYERMMRDARINLIGEGANDVLRAYTALVGMRDVGLELKGVAEALFSPLANLGKLGGFASRQIEAMFASPEVPVRAAELEPAARRLGKLVGMFGQQVQKLLRTYREEIIDRQYQQGRVADAAIELFVSGSVLSRLDGVLRDGHVAPARRERERRLGLAYLAWAERRVRRSLAELWDHDDETVTALADLVLAEDRCPPPGS